MNASRMRREGRNNFCPEDTPEEYFKRVGRNPSLYGMNCFKQGWDEAAQDYEKEHKEPTPDEEEKLFTLQDIKDAYEDGYYEGAGDDAWYRDHNVEPGYTLDPNASVHKPMNEHVEHLLKREKSNES